MKHYIIALIMIISFGILLGINVYQTNMSRALENDIKKLEIEQKKIITQNNNLNKEITNLLNIENLIDESESLGLIKKNPKDITYIIVGGKGHDL